MAKLCPPAAAPIKTLSNRCCEAISGSEISDGHLQRAAKSILSVIFTRAKEKKHTIRVFREMRTVEAERRLLVAQVLWL